MKKIVVGFIITFLPFLAGAHGGLGELPDKPFIQKEVNLFSLNGALESIIYILFIIFLTIEIINFFRRRKNNAKTQCI
ncbi:MAG: hypothetical protein COV02_01860 [Candidatus Terrybacteria bacterium CG10_big_fil_rev_8_21_14_0_10_41_10]|uniref:Uncharacterized protein n=1 Tax=Candidatus Terrybacteria bacterium CG10_big_fil_rev_8_21_14_0_10_41_10 TaxID=1975026 RepID=A0A2M8LAH1_9BACT|nr:MAG: hypothetical protein COV02_01860 [Candidatus Terrybacteria bacterium CG10_big_fil_rev_8_21_14_0_10_41_10]